MTTLQNLAGALLAAALLAWVGPTLLDASHRQPILVDNHIEHHIASELQAAQNDAQREARFQRAARDLCVAEHGPQTTWTTLPDGSIQCINRRGTVLALEARH